MAELSFEARLERLFAETPPMRDAEVFRLQVLDKLDRGWTARRFLIGGMGAAGGLIGSAQLLGAGAVGQIRGLGEQATAFLNQQLTQTPLVPAGVTLDTSALWMALALAVAAAGFGIVRAIREI
jgi:hypothetical protein